MHEGNCTASKIPSISNNLNASWSPNGHYIALGNKVLVFDLELNDVLRWMLFAFMYHTVQV
jgi:hypothetical protein